MHPTVRRLEHYLTRSIDGSLFGIVLALLALGLVALVSASNLNAARVTAQLANMLIALGVLEPGAEAAQLLGLPPAMAATRQMARRGGGTRSLQGAIEVGTDPTPREETAQHGSWTDPARGRILMRQ